MGRSPSLYVKGGWGVARGPDLLGMPQSSPEVGQAMVLLAWQRMGPYMAVMHTSICKDGDGGGSGSGSGDGVGSGGG